MLHKSIAGLLRIQTGCNEVFKYLLEKLKGKRGFLRGNILGMRVNFSARCVIVPQAPGKSIDEITIPYLTFLELYKFQLINIYRKLHSCSYEEATKNWHNALSTFDSVFYSAMEEMIKKAEGLPVLLNRNPTINFGSILLMRITDVKKDLNDYTLSLNNAVLPSLGADYDGDVLNIISLIDEDFDKIFEAFSPKKMVISRDLVEMNSNFLPNKDYILGLHILTES